MESSQTILLVESNLFIGGILSQKLKKDGYNVVSTRDGKEGLHKIVDVKPSAVFLDLPMGQIKTFLGVLRKIQREHQVVFPPIVVLSDVEAKDEITTISEMGVQSYLIKSYTNT